MLTTGSSGASCIQREHLEISLQINISCSTPGSGTHALLLYLTGIKKKTHNSSFSILHKPTTTFAKGKPGPLSCQNFQ
jgi:hypothetical protein